MSDHSLRSYDLETPLVSNTSLVASNTTLTDGRFTDKDNWSKAKNSMFRLKDTASKSVSFKIKSVDSLSIKSSADPHSEEILKYSFVSPQSPLDVSSRKVSEEIKTEISNTKSVLENIQEVDEDRLSEPSPGYYGWDGYQARFEDSFRDDENQDYIPKCIPPWAKTIRNKYSHSSLGSFVDDNETEDSKRGMQEKIEKLMRKHNDLMLVKRVENKKQLIVEPSKCQDEMDTVKMRTKNTRYYMTPLSKSDEKRFVEDYHADETDELMMNDNMSITKKTSRPQAKRELSSVLKSLHTRNLKKQNEFQEDDYMIKKESVKCPKITLSKIREYVNAQAMDPDERKLHEIIKIEKVPSMNMQDKGKPGSKYIINVPQSKKTDIATVNIIKIKEKRKLRINSIEDINEKTTEIQYGKDGSKRHTRRGNDYGGQEHETDQYIKKKTKSPTETKTFEITSKVIPQIAPLIDQNEKKTDKVLLMQYEKKSKHGKTKHEERKSTVHTTQLLGITQPAGATSDEMYVYGSETEGGRKHEKVTKVEDIPPTLKDKVNLIFQELREMTFKRGTQPELTSSEIQVCPDVSSKTTQRSSWAQVSTGIATVQAKPDVASVEIQVRDSQLLRKSSLTKPQTSPYSQTSPDSTDLSHDTQIEEEILDEISKRSLQDLMPDKEILEGEPSVTHTDSEQGIVKKITVEDVQPEQVDEIPSLKKSMEKNDEEKITRSETTEETKVKGVTFSQLGAKIKSYSADIPEDTMEEEIAKQEKKEPTEDLEEVPHKTAPTHQNQEELKPEEMKSIQEPTAYADMKIEEPAYFDEKIIDEEKPSQISTTTKKNMEKVFSRKESKGEEKRVASRSEPGKSFEADNQKSTYLSKQKISLDKSKPMDEDIRSYDFDPQQGTELKIQSSSKFLHQKDSIRKNMDWTEDTMYLEKHLCPQLIRGLAETAVRRPADPISFLAHWIYKDYHNHQTEELAQVRDEHLQLSKAMMDIGLAESQVRKKFNIRKYPAERNYEEEPSRLNTEFEQFEQQNEITQDV